MNIDFAFVLNSALLGVGLAMDAFSVSIANGMQEKDMKSLKRISVASTYAFFQFLMPMLGWLLVHTVAEKFSVFEKFIPIIALILLSYIGGKMIYEYFKERGKQEEETENVKRLTFLVLMLQGIATSIDALSVGFVIGEYSLLLAFISSIIIAIVTLILCLIAIFLGNKLGKLLSKNANLIGGLILIGIGLEIFIKGIITYM